MVKNGLKSDPYLRGNIKLTRDWTICEQTSGVGAITVIGSQVKTNSQSNWMCEITGVKDLNMFISYIDGMFNGYNWDDELCIWLRDELHREFGEEKVIDAFSVWGEWFDLSFLCGIWTCRTTPINGKFRVCPGVGGCHWSMSWQANNKNIN